jgi:hypothetical protein
MFSLQGAKRYFHDNSGNELMNRDWRGKLDRCPLHHALRTQIGHRLGPEMPIGDVRLAFEMKKSPAEPTFSLSAY